VRVLQERTLEGRLFKIAGAAKRKPRAPNEMLQRVTGEKAGRSRSYSSARCVLLDQINKIQVKEETQIYIVPLCEHLAFNMLRYYTCLYLVRVHQKAPPLIVVANI